MKIEESENEMCAYLIFSSGRKIKYGGEPLSLECYDNLTSWCIREGYDDVVIDSDGCFDDEGDEIAPPSNEDMRELCDYMINEWSKFKEIFKR